MCIGMSWAADPPSPEAAIARAADTPHPRLFLPDRLPPTRAHPLRSPLRARIVGTAEQILDLPTLERRKQGKRLLGVSRNAIIRIAALSYAHHLGDPDGRFAARAREELLAVSAFSDWNPSHFLDVGEMTTACAIGYDWLYDVLSEEDRTTIKTAILDKGLKPSFGKGMWWIRRTHNWNQVCHGGMVMGALAIAEDEPEMARRVLARAVECLPLAMNTYGPDGAYPEGPGYWEYGTTYNVLALAAMESACGTDFGLADIPGFLQSANYMRWVTAPSLRTFTYSDSSGDGRASPAMYWMAGKLGDPSVLWMQQTLVERMLGWSIKTSNTAERFLPMLDLWLGDELHPRRDRPDTIGWHGNGRTPVAVFRSGWEQDAIYLGLKGGDPGGPHGHMDVGSFVLEADGVRWAEDLGSQSYHKLEAEGIDLWNFKQDSERWTVFRHHVASHNTLMVDGKRQQVSGQVPITGFELGTTFPHAIFDLSSAYAGQLTTANRGAGIHRDGAVWIQDEIRADTAAEVRWAMMTKAEVVLSEDGRRAALSRDGQTMMVDLVAPETARFGVLDTSKGPAPYDADNPGTRMLTITLELADDEAMTIAVQLTPGSSGRARGPKLGALHTWRP